MENIFQQLGVDWKLFLSQAANFFIILLVLQAFAYKPLLRVVKERNKKISDGLMRAKEAEARLHEVDRIAKARLKEAEKEFMAIIKQAEARAAELEKQLAAEARQKHHDLLAQLEVEYHAKQREAHEQLLKESAALVKQFIIKSVQADPKHVDEALIKKAIAAGKPA